MSLNNKKKLIDDKSLFFKEVPSIVHKNAHECFVFKKFMWNLVLYYVQT